MRQRILRAVTFLVIFFFAWTMGGMFNIAYAAYNEIQKPAVNQKQSLRPGEKFQKAVDDLRDVISRKASWSTRRNELKEKRNAIESLDAEIKSQFAETEKKLKNAGLPQEILQRHYNFVKHYEDNLKELRTNLDAADIAQTDAEFEKHAKKIRQYLEKVAPPRKHKALDPNKLPHRLSDIKRKEPRTRPEEFKKDLKQTAKLHRPQHAPGTALWEGIEGRGKNPTAVIPTEEAFDTMSFRPTGEIFNRSITKDVKDSSPRHSGIRNDSNNVIPRLDRGIQSSAIPMSLRV